MELLKIDGQEKILSDIIKNCIREIIEAVNNNKYHEEKANILNNLEKINLFTINPYLVTLMTDETDFPPALVKLTELSLYDPDNNTNENESLLSHEIALLKKISDSINDPYNSILVVKFNLTKDIIDSILHAINDKNNYRDLLLDCLKMLSNYINNADIFYSYLKDKLDEKFIDKLNNIQENHLDDMEVTKEISNILCKLCMKSETLANHISNMLPYFS